MAPRKVLLLTYHFPPSAAVAVYRMLGLVRYLPRFGWQPVVVAPPWVPGEPQDEALLDQVPAGTPVERVPLASGGVGKVFRYFAPLGHWLPRAWPACRRVIREHRPEAIITSSPPGCVHNLGLALRWRTGLPWVACFRDPWVTNQAPGSLPWNEKLERVFEARVMKRAGVVVANTPLNQQGLRAAYPDYADKVVTITNGFDPEKFQRVEVRRAPSGPLTLLHAGELYGGRDPRPLLDVLKEFRDHPAQSPRLRVEFLGRTTETRYDLPTEVRARGLHDVVRVEGQVPYAEALARVMRADILLLVHRPDYRVGVPAKLYEYLGAGRPILALAEPDGDVAWALRTSGVLHRVAPPRDAAAIRRALVELTAEVVRGTPAVGDEAALATFTREHMARRFAECLDAYAGRPAPAAARSAAVAV